VTRTEIRWVLLPFEVVLGFVLSGIAIGLLVDQLHVWFEPVVGFLVAIVVVVTAYVRAPARPILAALVSYVLGAAVAYALLRSSYYPENTSRAYEPTLIPLWATLVGGAVALLAVVAHTFRKTRSTSNKSLERTRER
jgi:hypothetical protein